MVSISFANATGNTFETGTDLFEFINSFGNIWVNNNNPGAACYKNVENDDIPKSTFGRISGLPDLC